jgi:hypothetical protein
VSRRASKRCFVFIVVLLAASSAVAATPQDVYKRAVELYESSYFAEAIVMLQSVLSPPSLSPKATRHARLLLAQCLFAERRKNEARAELKTLLRSAPSTMVTSEEATPEFVALFQQVKNELAKEAEPPPAPKKPRPQETPRVAPQPVSQPHTVSQPQVVVPASEPTAKKPETTPILAEPKQLTTAPLVAPWYQRMWPFGIGHFLNHDYAAGAAFLATEVVLVGANVGISVLNATERRPNGGFPQIAIYPTMYWMQLATAIAAYALVAFDIIDALVLSPKRVKASVAAAPLPSGGAALSIGGVWP